MVSPGIRRYIELAQGLLHSQQVLKDLGYKEVEDDSANSGCKPNEAWTKQFDISEEGKGVLATIFPSMVIFYGSAPGLKEKAAKEFGDAYKDLKETQEKHEDKGLEDQVFH